MPVIQGSIFCVFHSVTDMCQFCNVRQSSVNALKSHLHEDVHGDTEGGMFCFLTHLTYLTTFQRDLQEVISDKCNHVSCSVFMSS